MCAPRSGQALHAPAVRAERDRPPTRLTDTPVVDLVRARRGPCSGYLTFYQNSAARKPKGPVPSLADDHCCTSVGVADRFPRRASQLLRNIQDCFKELLRGATVERRPGAAYRMELFLSVFTPTRGDFPIKQS